MFTYLLTIDVIISLYLFPYLYPSPISFMVSVDVNHHVHLLTDIVPGATGRHGRRPRAV